MATPSDDPKAASATKQVDQLPPRFPLAGRLCEIATVIALAGCFLVLSLEIERSSAVLLIGALLLIGIVCYRGAIHYAVAEKLRERADADRENSKIESEAKLAELQKYKVTEARIRTLREVGVPRDITLALWCFENDPPVVAKEFLDRLAFDPRTDLGPERVNDYREQILKYTKDEGKPRPPITGIVEVSENAGSNGHSTSAPTSHTPSAMVHSSKVESHNAPHS